MSTASSATSALSADRVTLDRRVPPLGGFNLTYLGIELTAPAQSPDAVLHDRLPRRDVRHHRPSLRDEQLTATPVADGGVSVAAYIMVSMAMYGAMMSATQTGAAVALERTQGGAGSCG
jgi:ABC-2 type transport system permease protein